MNMLHNNKRIPSNVLRSRLLEVNKFSLFKHRMFQLHMQLSEAGKRGFQMCVYERQ